MMDNPIRKWPALRAAAMAAVAVLMFSFAGEALAQVAPTISKAFAPSSVPVNTTSILTVTVTNPNAFPITNVQFSDVMPAGVTLITQTGGTCGTLATGGGMFSINPGVGTFSSTSAVLAAGQACTISVRVQPTVIGAHVNTTSPVTAIATPPGAAAVAILTATGPVAAVAAAIPALGPWQLAILIALFALLGRRALRRSSP